MVCAMAREVGLDAAIDMEAAEELLQEHAAAVILHLQHRGVAGDGNCLFRAAACQVPEGEEHHVALRAICAAGAADAWERYAPYLPPCGREQVLEWCRNMAQDRFWGDGLACRVLTDCLKRPMIIWRLMEPEQRPSCFVPALGMKEFAGLSTTGPWFGASGLPSAIRGRHCKRPLRAMAARGASGDVVCRPPSPGLPTNMQHRDLGRVMG